MRICYRCFTKNAPRAKEIGGRRKYGNPLWAVPLLFVVTVVVAAAGGDLLARFFSEPVNRMLRKRWSHGRRQLGSVVDSSAESPEL